jgi:hypothetical protein
MKNERNLSGPPEEIRRLARDWRRMPIPSIYRLFSWRYSMKWADVACFHVASDPGSDWWRKATETCPDRHRVLLMAAAFVGECYRRHRRLRGEWVRCDQSDYPERDECPCWLVHFPCDRTTDCVFKDFLGREEMKQRAGESMRSPDHGNGRNGGNGR